jgi:hypothetical protein
MLLNRIRFAQRDLVPLDWLTVGCRSPAFAPTDELIHFAEIPEINDLPSELELRTPDV